MFATLNEKLVSETVRCYRKNNRPTYLVQMTCAVGGKCLEVNNVLPLLFHMTSYSHILVNVHVDELDILPKFRSNGTRPERSWNSLMARISLCATLATFNML